MRKISIIHLRYADDNTIISDDKDSLQEIVREVILEMNIKKTQKMIDTKNREDNLNIVVDYVLVEQVDTYKCLGAFITDDGKIDTEIKTRISIAKPNSEMYQ